MDRKENVELYNCNKWQKALEIQCSGHFMWRWQLICHLHKSNIIWNWMWRNVNCLNLSWTQNMPRRCDKGETHTETKQTLHRSLYQWTKEQERILQMAQVTLTEEGGRSKVAAVSPSPNWNCLVQQSFHRSFWNVKGLKLVFSIVLS